MVTACATDACDGPGCDCAAHFMTPEEELAANAAVVWNECADAVGPEDAEGALTWAEQLGRVVRRCACELSDDEIIAVCTHLGGDFATGEATVPVAAMIEHIKVADPAVYQRELDKSKNPFLQWASALTNPLATN